MVLILKKEDVDEAKALLRDAGEEVFDLGSLISGNGEQVVMKSKLE
jgi:hypothetical protein